MRRLALVVALLLGACGDPGPTDAVLGDPCNTAADCEGRCYTDLDTPSDFPGGFCSLSCTSDLDCPAEAACVDKQGGMCLFVCPAFDCTFLGPGWRCDNKDRTGAPGEVSVCIGD